MKKKQTHAEELISNPVIEFTTVEAIENFCKLLDEPDPEPEPTTEEQDLDLVEYKSDYNSPLDSFERIKDIIREDAEDIDDPTFLVEEVYNVQVALKALQTIIACNNDCPDNNKVIRLSSYDRPDYLGGEKLHVDYLVIGNACFVISAEERDILREVLHCE